MKKGDRVVIDDGSFSKQVKDNKLSHGPGGDRYKNLQDDDRKQYVIIETGCSFPKTGSQHTCNNTVIQIIKSDKVIFIEERFLKLVSSKHKSPKHKIMINLIHHFGYGMGGDIIEISDKLYKEIKREAQ